MSTMTLSSAPHPRLEPTSTTTAIEPSTTPQPPQPPQQTEKDVVEEAEAEINHLCCPNCGFDITPSRPDTVALQEAQRQIGELQAQVKLLNEKATAAGMRPTTVLFTQSSHSCD